MKLFWNDKNVFNINSLPRYASGFPIGEDGSYTVKKLSGMWRFRFCEKVGDVPESFGQSSFDYSDFGEIKVPSEWQIQGIDTPIYTNIIYPKAVGTNIFTLPKINADKTSAGLYVCEFEHDTSDGRFFIHFGGVNSCAEVYLNGSFVGYSEDTFDFQEYDVSDFLKEGNNVLSVIVYRYCTGSYLEDQDMWRLSGIFRDVYLIRKPQYEISDLYVKCNFTKPYFAAQLLSAITVNEATEDMSVRLDVFDNDNCLVRSVDIPITELTTKDISDFDKVVCWSHENPYLYRLDFTLTKSGVFCDKRSINFGFREVRIQPMIDGKGPFILLNGKPIKFRGVNRHEFHPDYGHAVPAELIYKDLLLCKENNITAIRTSHYPNQRIFYEYCDRLGILVMCENNLETHGLSMFIPGNSKLWTKHCIYRMQNMVNTYKNHPCIVSWSLGNESGFGTAFAAMKQAALTIDDTRFIHYEEDVSGKVSDVYSTMYEKQETMDAIGQNKTVVHCFMTVFRPLGVLYTPNKYKNLPYMQCEYAHCMGNSLGNFADYWEKFKQYDRLAGGFIWDFADQAIKYVREDGTVEYRFGGDFGDKPNDGVFAFNGIVRADRLPNPALYEVRKQYQMVDFSLNGSTLSIKNNHMFTDIGGYTLRITFSEEGKAFSTYEEKVPSIASDETGTIELRLPVFTKEGDILCELIPPYQTTVIAYEQFLVNETTFRLPELSGDIFCDDKNPWEVRIYNEEIQYIVDFTTGGITSIKKGDTEILRTPIIPNFVRACIDNDRGAFVNIDFVKTILGVYKFHKAQKKIAPKKPPIIERKDGVVSITLEWKFKYGKLNTRYTFGKEGVDLELKVKPNCELIRYGFSFATREPIREMSFYARGPHENYCDRKTSALLAAYTGVPEEFSHEYLSPQENGNHTDARYLKVTDDKNIVLITAKDAPFEFGVLPYSMEKLEKAEHAHELIKDDHYTITVDGKQRGVGGDTPAMAVLKPQYKIKPGEIYTVSVRLQVR